MRVIDTHAHAFTITGPLAAGRRYTPEADAPLTEYMAELDGAGATHGVLVQPSFLGTDNSYLLDCLRRHPDRLRGIAVIDPSWSDRDLAGLDAAGVVGIRLNLLGQAPDFVVEDDWQALFRRVAARDWQIEIHDEGNRLPFLLDALWPCGAKIVIDHFGRPAPSQGLSDPGVSAALARADAGRLWIKLSAPYRCLGQPETYARRYLDAFGAAHLLWGSDWPWTQHAQGMRYRRTLDWLEQWLPAAPDRATVLDAAPARLFRFDTAIA